MPPKKSPTSVKRGSASSKKGSTSSRSSSSRKKVVAKKPASPKKVVAKRTSASSKRTSASSKRASSSRSSSSRRTSSSAKKTPPKKIVIKSTPAKKPLNVASLSETQVKNMAKKHGIKVTPRMKKAELVKLIQQKAQKSPAAKQAPSVEVSDEVVSEEIVSSSEQEVSSEEVSSEDELPYTSPAKASPAKASPTKASPTNKTLLAEYRKYSMDKLKEECKESKIPRAQLKGKNCEDFKTSNRRDLELAMVKHQLEKLKKEKEALERKQKQMEVRKPQPVDYGFSTERWTDCPEKQEYYDIASRDCKPPSYEGFSREGIHSRKFESGGKSYTIAGTDSQLKEFEHYFNKRSVAPPPPKPAAPKNWWESGCYDKEEYKRNYDGNPKTYACEAEEFEKPGVSKNYDEGKNPNKYYLETDGGRKIYSMTLPNLEILQRKIGGEIYEHNPVTKQWNKPGTSQIVSQSVHTTLPPAYATPAPVAEPPKRVSPAVKAVSPVRPPQPAAAAPLTQNEDEIIRNVREEFAKCLKNLSLT